MELKKCIILAGPPGSGKGTQSKIIAESTGFVHISTGDIIRSSGEQRLMDLAANGKFISDLDGMRLASNFIQSHPNAPGFIWDGYPRTKDQAHTFPDFLARNGLQADALILLQANGVLLLDRLLKRAREQERADDAKDIVVRRFNDYHSKTVPAINVVQEEIPGIKVLNIDAENPIEDISHKIIQFLAEINLIPSAII